ncbi:cell division protein ZipA [Bibersteinia trehalosi]|uniref:Cell division protein ZipA n=1 Tax=Bibersteinia trehalosi TaxID=47735 RepID=A0A3R8LET4_BIBTR|nr:cell division protein ZipA [Bibersteinia trehalosi]RRN03432.1 cell division protein ZipA [Bibersteinia trehalosi]
METSTLFFILAGLLIAFLVGYSLWSARREKSRVFSNTFSTRPVSAPVGSQSNAEIPSTLKPEGFSQQTQANEFDSPERWQAEQQEIDNQVREINIKLPNQAENNIAQPQANIFTQQVEVQSVAQAEYVEETQIRLQSENENSVTEPVQEPNSAENTSENNMLTLYVVAPEGGYFNGLNVVQHLENLGLQYGEYHIFHRHIDNTDSPILFSVANMMQPGVFDLNNIENFATVGLVFFMHLPSPTNDLANLRIMINTADSLAQSLGGFVLNDQQQIFDERSRQEYVQRIRAQ